MSEKVTDTGMTSSEGVKLEKYVDTRIAEIHRAVDKAEELMGARLEGMNHIREALIGRVDALECIRDIATGKASQNSVIWTAALALIGLIISVIQLFTR